jgi:uncharacterized membrane protein YfhO
MLKVEVNRKKASIKVDGKIKVVDDLIAENIGARNGLEAKEIVARPEAWLAIYEVSQERFDEITEKYNEQIEMYQEAYNKAKNNNSRVNYYSYTTDCNSRREQCDIDQVNLFVKPNGYVEEERIHTC